MILKMLIASLISIAAFSVEEEIFIPQAKGLILLGSEDQLLSSDELKKITGLQIIGLCLPGKEAALDKILSCIYLDKPIHRNDLTQIKIEISKFYEKNGFPLVAITIPEQDVTDGVLQLIVTPSQVGNIYVRGNCYTNSKRLENYIELKSSDPVNQKTLIRDLYCINRNPFRKVDAIYSPGNKPGTTDITLYALDRRPYRFYVGVDDTGVKTTGRERWFTGFNWGNVFGLDHVLSFQYTTTWSIHNFQAYTLQYMAPLPWRHTLSLYGGFSNVHAKLRVPNLHVRNHGMSGQASLRYSIPSFLSDSHKGQWGIGGDYKRTNNNVEYTELLVVFGQNVNLTQLVLGYSGEYEANRFTFDYELQLYWSPGEWLPDQTNADFASLRPKAKNKWLYGRAEACYTQKLPFDTLLMLKGRGQFSDNNLLPMEQFYIGGYDTVRGYEERQLNYDNGVIFNAEYRSASFRVLTRNKPCKLDGAQFLVFFDYGYGRDHNKITGLAKNDFLMGAGPGIRYTYDPNIAFRLDWGIKLHHAKPFQGGASMLHFSFVASY